MLSRWATDEREADRAIVLQNDERMGAVICEPASHQLWFAFAEFAGGREDPGVHAQLGEVFEVVAIAFLDPATVLRGMQSVSNTDWHGEDSGASDASIVEAG